MSNELLRIHDENNNCDLVAVTNPMGNFHMSTYAEMQDGTQKPVDGWYLFSKMMEKLGQGGGKSPEYDIIFSKGNDGRYTVVKGNREEVIEKMANHEPITGIYIDYTASETTSILNTFMEGSMYFVFGNTSYYGVGLYWQADGRLTDE